MSNQKLMHDRVIVRRCPASALRVTHPSVLQPAGITIPYEHHEGPIRALRLEVVAGPDKGLCWSQNSEVVTIGTAEDNDLVLTDHTVSRYHAELRCRMDRVLVRDHGSTNGTHVGPVQLLSGNVASGTVMTMGRTFIKVFDGESIPAPGYELAQLHDLIGQSPGMRRLMDRIVQVAPAQVSVLLMGETGTGKEVVARTIHEASPRADGPFEIVDCGALTPTLIASELFGHERGAFTGADQRYQGAFERADKGTLFLDEIGELSPELQVRLLGVLERKRFRRLGSTAAQSTDVRVVCATHRDLRAWVNSGRFRQDLYYRIAVARLEIPPLRERLEDIALLAEHFLQGLGVDLPVEQVLDPDTLAAMHHHQWPGNVRELRNFVETALAFGEPEKIDSTAGDKTEPPGEDRSTSFSALYKLPYREARDHAVADFQRAYLQHLVEEAGGNVSHAAEAARMSRPHLMQLLKRLGLRP